MRAGILRNISAVAGGLVVFALASAGINAVRLEVGKTFLPGFFEGESIVPDALTTALAMFAAGVWVGVFGGRHLILRTLVVYVLICLVSSAALHLLLGGRFALGLPAASGLELAIGVGALLAVYGGALAGRALASRGKDCDARK